MNSKTPSGTVSFLFTDIEGSTELWEKQPAVMKTALAKHDALLKQAIESNGGHVVKSTGDGIHAVFATAMDAVNATITAQRAFGEAADVPLRIRMGIHTGEAELRDGDYFGQTLNRAQRIMAAGHGGQILLSEIAAQVAREHLAADVSLLDLGMYSLKGLPSAERIYQIVAPGLQSEFPALNSIAAATNNLPVELTSFIGRERELAEAREKLAGGRLLTLIGPGGIGKTRLALQIATEHFAQFKDGVWLVELAPVTDPGFVVSTIASVLGVREVSGVGLLDLLVDYLRARELL
ncbi:MAG TPA: adenylate/guanylate cyclase domain-containing protein, partial [Anaerolineales bacterium]